VIILDVLALQSKILMITVLMTVMLGLEVEFTDSLSYALHVLGQLVIDKCVVIIYCRIITFVLGAIFKASELFRSLLMMTPTYFSYHEVDPFSE